MQHAAVRSRVQHHLLTGSVLLSPQNQQHTASAVLDASAVHRQVPTTAQQAHLLKR
jgi:hypothetical protein